MTHSDSTECIFCKIVAGEIPSFRIYEDEATLAFMDINPASPGHALVIPKVHAADLMSIDAQSLAAVTRTARRVARAVSTAMAPAGLNLVQSNGEAAGQSVFHFHMHVLPRRAGDELKMNWGLAPGDMKDIQAACERIKETMEESQS